MYDLGLDGEYGTSDDGGERKISTTPKGYFLWQGKIPIWGNNIVYTNTTNLSIIHIYNLTTKEETFLIGNSYYSDGNVISGISPTPTVYKDIIVYVAYNESGFTNLYLYNISTKEKRKINIPFFYPEYPVIYRDKIVYKARPIPGPPYDYYLYMYDLFNDTEIQITKTPLAPTAPTSIYENLIVWTNISDTPNLWCIDYFVYNLSSNKIIFNFSFSVPRGVTSYVPCGLDIWGDKFVYEHYDVETNNTDIFVYNLTLGINSRLTFDSIWDGYPAIYDDKIVWIGNENNVYLTDLTIPRTIYKVTPSSGGTEIEFNYTLTYFHLNNIPPT